MKNKNIQEIVISQDDIGINRLIHNLDKKMFKVIIKKLDELNISQIQSLVIIYLYTFQDKDVFQIDLEKEFGLTNPTMTASIKSMITKDMVIKEKSKQDGRYYNLSLTEKGKELFPKCEQIYFDIDQLFSNILEEEEIIIFKEISNKILKKLEIYSL